MSALASECVLCGVGGGFTRLNTSLSYTHTHTSNPPPSTHINQMICLFLPRLTRSSARRANTVGNPTIGFAAHNFRCVALCVHCTVCVCVLKVRLSCRVSPLPLDYRLITVHPRRNTQVRYANVRPVLCASPPYTLTHTHMRISLKIVQACVCVYVCKCCLRVCVCVWVVSEQIFLATLL